MKTLKLTFAALALAASASAIANGFPVEINGNFTTNTRTGDINSTVNGTNAKGDINVAGIQGNARVTGQYNATVQSGNISTNVQGNGASGSINVGGIQSYRQ